MFLWCFLRMVPYFGYGGKGSGFGMAISVNRMGMLFAKEPAGHRKE